MKISKGDTIIKAFNWGLPPGRQRKADIAPKCAGEPEFAVGGYTRMSAGKLRG